MNQIIVVGIVTAALLALAGPAVADPLDAQPRNVVDLFAEEECGGWVDDQCKVCTGGWARNEEGKLECARWQDCTYYVDQVVKRCIYVG